MSSELPVPGVSREPLVLEGRRVDPRRAAISSAASLCDLLDEYRFYTPAVLFLHARLGDLDPIADCEAALGRELPVVSFQFDRPIFRGLEAGTDTAWNHVLFAMPPDACEAWLQWASSLILFDRWRRSLAQACYNTFKIEDPLWKQKNPAADGPAPMVKVAALAVDATYGLFWLEPQGRDLPCLRSRPVGSPKLMRLARAVFDEAENPLLVVESAEDCEKELEKRWRKAKGVEGEGADDDAPGGDSGRSSSIR